MIGKILGIGTAMVLASSVASAQVVGIGTTKGTAVDQMVAAIAKTVSSHSGIQMRSQAAGGSQRYIELVNAGQLEFGVANSMQTAMAVQGTGISEGRKYEDLRMVGTLMAFRNGVVVRNDSDIKTAADLKGKRLPYDFKAAPLFSFFIDAVLANGGLTIDDAEKVPVAALAPSWELLKQGRIDAAITATGSGATAEMDSRTPSGIRFLNLESTGPGAEKSQEILPRIYLVDMDPSSKLPGIRGPVSIFGYDFLLWAHKDVDNDIVKRVAKALHDHAEELKASAAMWRTYDPKQLGKDHGENLAYHPGAIAFFKEAGIWNR
ncbi:MAG: TAXI family TRAP transporter solute-binding subunit [Rhodospirillaceae bacterium]